MAIRRGTTPTLTITAENIDLIGKTVYVTIDQAGHGQLTKLFPNNDGTVSLEQYNSDTLIHVFLSQHDTMAFRPGKAQIQIRWIEEDGTAHASDIVTITLTKTLLEGVIKYVE